MALKLPEIVIKGLNSLPGVNIGAHLVSGVGSPSDWLLNSFGASKVLSGENVNGNTSLELSAFYAALRNISEDIAKLPVNIFRVVDGGKVKVNTNGLFNLLNNQANPYVSSMNLYQTLTHWALNHGNGYAEIVRNGVGDPVEMWLIHPSRVRPFFKENGDLFYHVSNDNTIQGKPVRAVEISAENIYSLAGLGGDGIIGYSIYQLMAQSIGIGLATQNCSASYYGNGTTLSGVLENPGKLSEDAYRRMRRSWDKLHAGGSENKNKVAILEEGTKFNATGSDAVNAQLIESRKFTVIEVARMLRIAPHKLQSTDKMTLNNLENQSREHIEDTLTPWVRRIRNETQRKLIRNPNIFAVHEINLLRLGDSKNTAGVIKTYINTGVMSINEGRDIIDQNRIDEDWANQHYIQMNITTVENVNDGANLRQKGNGQNGSSSMESGEKDPEGRDPAAVDSKPDVDMIDAFDEAKAAHLPNFMYAARRILNKESKSLQAQLSKHRQDHSGFEKWADHFFSKQKADIVDVFGPCCQVFVNTFKLASFEFDAEFLAEFADRYAFDGVEKVMLMFKKQANEEVFQENTVLQEEKMANLVINLIGSKAKEAQNEDK